MDDTKKNMVISYRSSKSLKTINFQNSSNVNRPTTIIAVSWCWYVATASSSSAAAATATAITSTSAIAITTTTATDLASATLWLPSLAPPSEPFSPPQG